MARVKPKRHGVVVDMTAMCDVAFLLLTFFILTTHFKKPDVEKITTPSSISETVLPDGGVMTVGVTTDGKFFFEPVEDAPGRQELLKKMAAKYNIKDITNADLVAFTKVQAIGVPMSKLKGFLELPEDAQKEYKSPTGVPMDSTKKELIDWIQQSMAVNPNYKLAIKGDVDTKYPKVKDLFEGLRDIDLLKFWLITKQESKPTE